MPQKTTTPRRKLHRRQIVAYYRGLAAGDDRNLIAAQKEIIRRWAAENGYELVEEDVDRTMGPRRDTCSFPKMIERPVTSQGDILYVIRMDTALWRRLRRGEMSLFYQNMSKHPGDRAVFVTTDKDLANDLPWRILVGAIESCCSHGHRIRKALAWHRAKRMGSGKPQP